MIQNKFSRVFPVLPVVLFLMASLALPWRFAENHDSHSILLNRTPVEFAQRSSISHLIEDNLPAVDKKNQEKTLTDPVGKNNRAGQPVVPIKGLHLKQPINWILIGNKKSDGC